MTIATDLGFEIGELYRVEAFSTSYLAPGMVVKFTRDDESDCPWFEYASGPKAWNTDSLKEVAIGLDKLVLVEQEVEIPVSKIVDESAHKPILLLYIQQQYPDDKVLKALVEGI